MIPDEKYEGEQNQTVDIELFKISYIGWAQIKYKKLSNIIHAVRLLKDLTLSKKRKYIQGMTLGNFYLSLARLYPAWIVISNRKDVSTTFPLACRSWTQVPGLFQCPLGVNPSKVNEGVWEGDGPTEVLSSIRGGLVHSMCILLPCCAALEALCLSKV